MAPNSPEVRYVACWAENDGVHWCACDHETIAGAMSCLCPDGRMFIRAWDRGILRSLNDTELQVFIVESRVRVLMRGQ
jgi:hypothetical protein